MNSFYLISELLNLGRHQDLTCMLHKVLIKRLSALQPSFLIDEFYLILGTLSNMGGNHKDLWDNYLRPLTFVMIQKGQNNLNYIYQLTRIETFLMFNNIKDDEI